MEVPGRHFTDQQIAEEIREQAQLRWFRPAEICEMFANYKSLDFLISQQPQTPTSGSFFMIPRHALRKFKKDGHVWSKKKDGKTIQESHVNLKVGKAEMECLYVRGQENENLQRRIFRMIKEGPLDIALFHYREDKEARKYCIRSKKTTKVTTQSSPVTGKTIPILGATGDGMPDYKSEFENQSFSQETKNDVLPHPGTPGGYYELQRNEKILKRGRETSPELLANNFDGYQDLMISQQNPDLKEYWKRCKRDKKSSIVDQETYQSLVPSSINHGSHQLTLPSQTAYTVNLSNIQRYVKLGDDLLGYDKDNEDQSFSQVIEHDIPLNPGIRSSLCESPESMKSMERFSKTCLPVADPTNNFGDTTNGSLRIRFEKLLSPSSISPKYDDTNADKIYGLIYKLVSLQKETPEKEILLEQKLNVWLLEKVAEGGSGLTMLDEGGAGVIHLAAALGYDWAVEATIVAAEIDANFRDKNGRTALDWAVHCGRMHTIEFLISNGGAH